MARFRTSARSVDMLGRQQIAGVPTAVSEIFKNAYDAYTLNNLTVILVSGEWLLDPRLVGKKLDVRVTGTKTPALG